MRICDELLRLARLDPNEPIFVLRGQDVLAPDTVRDWANRAEAADVSPTAKIRDARRWAKVMMMWEPRKLPD